MARPPEPLFVERHNYRRRRLSDAAKLLPVIGLVLILLPVLWSDAARTSSGILYLFGVWALLIVVVAFLSRLLTATEPPPGEDAHDHESGG